MQSLILDKVGVSSCSLPLTASVTLGTWTKVPWDCVKGADEKARVLHTSLCLGHRKRSADRLLLCPDKASQSRLLSGLQWLYPSPTSRFHVWPWRHFFLSLFCLPNSISLVPGWRGS